MIYNFDEYNYLIQLEWGERLRESLEQFVVQAKLEGAWVSGVGAASDLSLGFYNLSAKEYKWRMFGGMYEIASLAGNIAFDEAGKLVLHLHGVFADDEYQTVGGHVQDFTAGGRSARSGWGQTCLSLAFEHLLFFGARHERTAEKLYLTVREIVQFNNQKVKPTR